MNKTDKKLKFNKLKKNEFIEKIVSLDEDSLNPQKIKQIFDKLDHTKNNSIFSY
jgi:hypothetical protein